jgi:hypothetical protein
MARSVALTMTALVCAAGVVTAGCASGPATGATPGRSDVVSADPRLAAAADTIQTRTAKGSTTFAGLVLDPWNHRLTVYRLPDPALDARIRAEVRGVRIIFRDATYSLAQMTRVIDRIMTDRTYWRMRGVKIGGAAPQANGSGVLVFVAGDPGAVQRRLSGHYPAMRITVQRQTVVPPTMRGPFPTITVTGPLPAKSSR